MLADLAQSEISMKTLFLAVSFLALSALGASAADLAARPYTKAPVAPPVEAYNWTGFYVGANVGGSWGRSNTDLTLAQPTRGGTTVSSIGSTSPAMNGVLGGLQAGYNWQTGFWVLGLETDIQITGQRGESRVMDTVLVPNECLAPCTPPPPTPVTGTFDYTRKLPWFGTLRGRLGVTPSERWLIYVTGGLAYGEVQSDATFSVPPTTGGACLAPCTPPPPVPTSVAASFRQIKPGWVLGGGIEAALWGNWTGKLEYLHVDLGGTSDTFASALAFPFFGTFTAKSRTTDEIVRVGLNYRFGGGVVAKY
jgi:outer membrane immunogenic protein